MKETGNIFDASTTLMEIEDVPVSEPDPPLEARPAAEEDDEPDYFTPPGTRSQAEVRRRGISRVAVIGGGGLSAVLVVAATGFGHGPAPWQTAEVAPPRTHPTVATSSAPPRVVEPAPEPRREPAPKPRTHKPKPVHHRAKPVRRHAHRHHASSSSAPSAPAPEPETAYTPEPEPTYTPEPEPTYVPVETAPPPPAPAPSSSSSGGSPLEFGIER